MILKESGTIMKKFHLTAGMRYITRNMLHYSKFTAFHMNVMGLPTN